jgi:DNA-binding XRE family transcriptional regulator
MSEHASIWKKWRKKHLLSQDDMARAVGLCRRTIQGIEKGEHIPIYSTQRKFRELRERYARARSGE